MLDTYTKTVYNKNRYFVTGNNNVGGFAGFADNAIIYFCYAVSYFDSSLGIEEEFIKDKTSYDIISTYNGSGFIANAKKVDVYKSSSFLNVYAGEVATLFIAKDSESNLFLSSVFIF